MSIKFCDTCDKLMESTIDMVQIQTPEGSSRVNYGIKYTCPICHAFVPGEGEEVRIFSAEAEGSGIGSAKMIALNRNIHLLGNDPTYCKVGQACPDEKCGSIYMTLLRSGQEEHVMLICKCGNTASYNPPDK